MYTLTTLSLIWYLYHVVKILKLRRQIIKKLKSMTEDERFRLRTRVFLPDDIKEKYDYDQSYPNSLEEAKNDILQYINIYHTKYQNDSKLFAILFLIVSLIVSVIFLGALIGILVLIVKYLP